MVRQVPVLFARLPIQQLGVLTACFTSTVGNGASEPRPIERRRPIDESDVAET